MKDSYAEALRQRIEAGATTKKLQLIDVISEGDDVVVVFRWSLNVNTYGMRFSKQWTYPAGPPVDVNRWADDVCLSLDEELLTGAVVWAGITKHEQWQEINPLVHRISSQREFFIDSADWGTPAGLNLEISGFDVTLGRRLLAQGSLVVWLQAYVDSPDARPAVGQAVIRWARRKAHVAQVDRLEIAAGRPPELLHRLAHCGVIGAANAGAVEIVVPAGAEPVVVQVAELLGFRIDPASGVLRLAATQLP